MDSAWWRRHSWWHVVGGLEVVVVVLIGWQFDCDGELLLFLRVAWGLESLLHGLHEGVGGEGGHEVGRLVLLSTA